jgi:two-component system, sensor histidine kinase and response regulator
MKKRQNPLNQFLFGNGENISLEEKMIIAAVAIGIIVCFIGGGMNLFLSYSVPALILPLVLGSILIYIFFRIKKRKSYLKMIFPMALLSLLGLGVVWIFNGGYNGTNSFVLYTAFVLILSISPTARFTFIYIFFVSLLFILHFIHYLYPSFIVQFPNERTRFTDTIITIFYTTGFIYMILTFLIRSYRTERENAKLANRKLEVLNNELKQSNASKDKLFSIIAHDLKSPFNSILGLSELTLQELRNGNTESTERSIEQTIVSTNRSLNLLENLLLWAKSQEGIIEFKPDEIHLKSLVDEVIESLELSAHLKNISVLYFQSEDVEITADNNMLKTILRNLLSNAIKYTGSGGKIRVYSKIRKGDVEITVSDTGVGMSEDVLASLFRIDSTKPKAGTSNEIGSGLGLVLCRDFVGVHGGTISAESKPGAGSKFIFTLPQQSKA